MFRKVYTVVDAMSAAGGFFAIAFPFGSLVSSKYQRFSLRTALVGSLFRYNKKAIKKNKKVK